MCEFTQSCSKVRRVIRQNLQGYRQTQILSLHLSKMEIFLVAANSAFLLHFNWPLNWPFWSNFSTEGVVFHEELGNAKKA